MTIKLVMAGLLLAIAPARTIADSTNYWVQPVNFALTAYVQYGANVVLHGALPTKQFLGFLSGLTNTGVVAGYQTNYLAVTNTVTNSLTINVTNAAFLPANDFPALFQVTNQYVLTLGTNTYTNDVPLTCTETATNPVTYFFENTVVISNATAYVVPSLSNLVTGLVTAVLVTNDSQETIFALTGIVSNSVPGTQPQVITNYAMTPDFTKQSGAKLLYVTPIVTSSSNFSLGTPTFVVRYKSGRTNVDTRVQAFFRQFQYTGVSQAISGAAASAAYACSEIDFFSQPTKQVGTYFNLIGFDTQSLGVVVYKGKPLAKGVIRQRKITVTNYGGQISATVEARKFVDATTVVTGVVTFGNGAVEPTAPALASP